MQWLIKETNFWQESRLFFEEEEEGGGVAGKQFLPF